ncbi:MAG: hypothetical protein JXD19_02700 [Deltaproteobacteria bacterium]|nr:hypothetical protein [Deltaproteobacteria bacterium]
MSRILVSIVAVTLFCSAGLCLDSEEIIRLNNAGVTEETIILFVKEKSQETCSFSVAEVLRLKEAGLSEATIQALIREASFIKNAGPVVYGKDITPITFSTAGNIIELKNAGVSDDVIKAIVISGSEKAADHEREEAWKMLKTMGIIVDKREAR